MICRAPTTRNLRAFTNINQEQKKNLTDLENLYPQTCLKKEGGHDGFNETSRNLEVLLKFQRTKEELT